MKVFKVHEATILCQIIGTLKDTSIKGGVVQDTRTLISHHALQSLKEIIRKQNAHKI